MLGNYYLNIIAFSLYFNKDIFLGRSIAKRIFKFQIVDAKTNLPANPLRCFVRNITVIAWPIEFIISLINNQRRVGDFIAGTKLVPYSPEEHNVQPNWLLIILALAASILFSYFILFYPIEVLTHGSGWMTGTRA